MSQEFVKLDRFDGTNFIRWKDKMMFLLTTLKISYTLDPNLFDVPAPKDEDIDQLKADRKKVRKMNYYVEDISSTIYLIVYMISNSELGFL